MHNRHKHTLLMHAVGTLLFVPVCAQRFDFSAPAKKCLLLGRLDYPSKVKVSIMSKGQ